MKITIYTPESSVRSPRKLIKDMFTDLSHSHELAWRLSVRDINAQYRQSKLGILWAFIMPLATTVTWIFLNMSGIISVKSTDIPYPLYVFSGTLIWSIFMDSLLAPLNQTNAAKSMLSKINFPREAIILSAFYQLLFNSGIKMLMLVIAVIIMGFSAGWMLLLFPFALLILILTGISIGLFLTPIGMLYNDIGRAISLGMQFVMYVSPVVFPIPISGWVRIPFMYNPITPLIMIARQCLTGYSGNFLPGFVIVSFSMLIVLFFSWMIYRITMPVIIERMSA
ncbi:MAG: ABC transporter permease [Bacteroidetes bacterium]|nr:ABC transporter permease [Bacteroidota bacterium]